MSDELPDTQAADIPVTEGYAWAREEQTDAPSPIPTPRGWLIPVLIAVVAAAVVSVAATLLLDAKALGEPKPPTYEQCQYYS